MLLFATVFVSWSTRALLSERLSSEVLIQQNFFLSKRKKSHITRGRRGVELLDITDVSSTSQLDSVESIQPPPKWQSH